jgi:hypothetical protein
MPESAKWTRYQVANPHSPLIVPHPEHPPSEEEDIEQDGEQDKHDRYDHRCQWDYHHCRVHTSLPPG